MMLVWQRLSKTIQAAQNFSKFNQYFKVFPAHICPDENVLKTFYRRLSSSSSEYIFKTPSRHLDQEEYIRLSCTSSEDLLKTSSRPHGQDQYCSLGHTSSRHLQDVFKTSCTNVLKTLLSRFQDILTDVFKTSSRPLAKAFSKCLQEDFKTYHQVKLFLLKRLRFK